AMPTCSSTSTCSKDQFCLRGSCQTVPCDEDRDCRYLDIGVEATCDTTTPQQDHKGHCVHSGSNAVEAPK
ncbi:hypothetical protein Bbelb_154130, partial [Branchiostoma belcheri]